MENVIESYLIRLGFSSDEPSFQKFRGLIEDAGRLVANNTFGMAKHILEAQATIVGGFTSLSGAILGIVDKAAMADQSYRLLGLRMMMTGDSARKLDIITSSLGASLEQIVWDPELHARAVQMAEDMDKLGQALGPGFEKSMKDVRDLRFEFTRLEVVGKFLGFRFAEDISKKLGFPDLTQKARSFIDSLSPEQVQHWSDVLSDTAIPILKDTWQMFKSLGEVAKEFVIAFQNVVGALSGDDSIEGTAVSLETVTTAIDHVVKGLSQLFLWIAQAERMLGHFAEAVTFLFADKFDQAKTAFAQGLKDLTAQSGAITGLAFGPEGAIIGGMLGKIGEETGATGAGQQGVEAATLPAITATPAPAPAAAQPSGTTRAWTEKAQAAIKGSDTSHWIEQSIAGALKGGALGWALRWLPGFGWLAGGAGATAGAYEGFTKAEPEYSPSFLFQVYEALIKGLISKTSEKMGTAHPPAVPSTPPSTLSAPPTQSTSLIDSIANLIARQEGAFKAGTIPQRQNNPGDLREWGKYPVVGGYAEFPDWNTGWSALEEQIRKNVDRGLNLYEFFAGKAGVYQGFAPQSDKNDPKAYAEAIARVLHIDPNVPLKQYMGQDIPHTAMERYAGAAQESPHATLERYIEVAPQRQSDLRPVSDYYQPPVAEYAADNAGWRDSWRDSTHPMTAEAKSIDSHNTITISLGGIYITQPNASADQIGRSVAEKMRDMLDSQTQFDLAQLSPQY